MNISSLLEVNEQIEKRRSLNKYSTNLIKDDKYE